MAATRHGHHQGALPCSVSSIFIIGYTVTNNYFDRNKNYFNYRIIRNLHLRGRASKKKKKKQDRNFRKDVEMSLRGWNKGKSSTVLCKGRKKGGKRRRGVEEGVSISQPRSPLENLISIPSIQQLYRSLIFDKG